MLTTQSPSQCIQIKNDKTIKFEKQLKIISTSPPLEIYIYGRRKDGWTTMDYKKDIILKNEKIGADVIFNKNISIPQQQLQIKNIHGNIIPSTPVVKHLHEQHITQIINEAMSKANITITIRDVDFDASSTIVKPGLAGSLEIGIKHGKELYQKGINSFIPIHHHMEALTTTRMINTDVNEFPYMVLINSGGHCLLAAAAVAKRIDNFLLLGQTIDDSPGEAFDKLLYHQNIPSFEPNDVVAENIVEENDKHHQIYKRNENARWNSGNFITGKGYKEVSKGQRRQFTHPADNKLW